MELKMRGARSRQLQLLGKTLGQGVGNRRCSPSTRGGTPGDAQPRTMQAKHSRRPSLRQPGAQSLLADADAADDEAAGVGGEAPEVEEDVGSERTGRGRRGCR
jgi:hypothetical protein